MPVSSVPLYTLRDGTVANYATTIFVGNAAVSVVDNAGCVNLLYLIEKCCNANFPIPSAHASVLKKYGLIDHANGVDDCIKKIVLNFVREKNGLVHVAFPIPDGDGDMIEFSYPRTEEPTSYTAPGQELRI